MTMQRQTGCGHKVARKDVKSPLIVPEIEHAGDDEPEEAPSLPEPSSRGGQSPR